MNIALFSLICVAGTCAIIAGLIFLVIIAIKYNYIPFYNYPRVNKVWKQGNYSVFMIV